MLASKKLAAFGVITLAVDEAAPSEFRIFKAGWNETHKGKFLFDEKAAKAVMAAYKKWGVDLAIDLNHQMLDEEPSPDPTAKDARGWCNLEVREDGSLWAINVRWTEDGAARLSEKRQRYISPAFAFDTKTNRVLEIMNIAMVAMPATLETPALVAAQRVAFDFRKLAVGPSFDDVRTVLNAALVEKYPAADPAVGAGPWIVAVYDASVVYMNDGKYFEIPYTRNGGDVALSGEPVEVIQTFAPVSGAPAPTPQPETPPPAPPEETPAAAKRIVMKLPKALVFAMLAALAANDQAAGLSCLSQATALAAGATPALPKELSSAALEAVANGDKNAALDLLKQILAALVGGDVETPAPDAGGGDEAAAAARVAMSTTGKPTIGEAMAELARRSKIAVDVEEREAGLARDRETLELDERIAITKSLQALGVETPATSGLTNGKLCERLLKEPIAELRARHAQLLAVKGKGAVGGIQPHVANSGTTADGEIVIVSGESVALSKRELDMIVRTKSDKQRYAADKLAHSKKTATSTT